MANRFDNDTCAVWVQGFEIDTNSPDRSKDSFTGVTQDGTPVRVRIDDMSLYKKKHAANKFAVIPEVAQISKGNPKRAGCRAHVDNSPERRTGGVILLEGIRQGTTPPVDQRLELEAKWPHILACGREDFDPLFAMGWIDRSPYLTVREDAATPEQARKLQVQIEAEIATLRRYIGEGHHGKVKDQQAVVNALQIEFDEMVRHRHRVALLNPDAGTEYRFSSVERLEKRLTDMLMGNTTKGASGGVLIQALDDEGRVIQAASGFVGRRWDHSLSGPGGTSGFLSNPINDVQQYLASPRGASLVNLNKSTTSIILTDVRMRNVGGHSNNKYARPEVADKVVEEYKHPLDHGNMVRHLALSMFLPKDQNLDGLQVKQYYSVSHASCTPIAIAPDGAQRDFSPENDHTATKGRRPSHTPNSRHIVEMPDGERYVATYKKGGNGFGMYCRNVRLEQYNYIGPARQQTVALSRNTAPSGPSR